MTEEQIRSDALDYLKALRDEAKAQGLTLIGMTAIAQVDALFEIAAQLAELNRSIKLLPGRS